MYELELLGWSGAETGKAVGLTDSAVRMAVNE